MRQKQGGDPLVYDKNASVTPSADMLEGLGRSFLFEALSEEELSAALRLAKPEAFRFFAGETLVGVGTPFPYLGYIAKGEATVSRAGERHAVVLNTLREGDIFGASALFGRDTLFSTNVTAKSDGVLLLIGQAAVEGLLSAFPPLAKAYVTYLSEKIRFLNRRLDVLAGRSTEEKLAAFLLHNAGNTAPLRFSKTALSSVLGLGRASLYRALDSLEGRGIIRTDRDGIEILHLQELEKILDEKQ